MPFFVPQKFKRIPRGQEVRLSIPRSDYNWLSEVAGKHNIAVTDLIRQTVAFARSAQPPSPEDK